MTRPCAATAAGPQCWRTATRGRWGGRRLGRPLLSSRRPHHVRKPASRDPPAAPVPSFLPSHASTDRVMVPSPTLAPRACHPGRPHLPTHSLPASPRLLLSRPLLPPRARIRAGRPLGARPPRLCPPPCPPCASATRPPASFAPLPQSAPRPPLPPLSPLGPAAAPRPSRLPRRLPPCSAVSPGTLPSDCAAAAAAAGDVAAAAAAR